MAKLLEVALNTAASPHADNSITAGSIAETCPIEQFENVLERSQLLANSVQVYSHPRSTFTSETLESHTLGII
jgi:hypothetical protein